MSEREELKIVHDSLADAIMSAEELGLHGFIDKIVEIRQWTERTLEKPHAPKSQEGEYLEKTKDYLRIEILEKSPMCANFPDFETKLDELARAAIDHCKRKEAEAAQALTLTTKPAF